MKKSTERILTAGLVLAMVVSPIVGFNRSVSRRVEEVKAVYTESMGISDQLSYRVNGARGLASLCDPAEPAYGRMQDAITALLEADSVHGQYAANAEIEALYPELAEAVSAEQTKQKEYYVNQLRNAQRVIEENSYPEAVEEFEEDVLGTLPGKLLRPLLWCGLPEQFS